MTSLVNNLASSLVRNPLTRDIRATRPDDFDSRGALEQQLITSGEDLIIDGISGFVGFLAEGILLALITQIFGKRKKKRQPEEIDAPSPNEDESRQTLPNQQIVVGRTTVYGRRDARFFYDASTEGSAIHGGTIADHIGSYLVEGYLLANHETRDVWHQLDGIDITRTGGDHAVLADQFRRRREDSGELVPFLWREFKNGLLDQARSDIIGTNFPNDSRFPPSFRCALHSLAILAYYYGRLVNQAGEDDRGEEHDAAWSSEDNERLGSREYRVRLDGLRCYNPFNADHDPNDESTWTLGETNAALIFFNLACSRLFVRNPQSFDDFDLDTLRRSWQVCEQGVPTRKSLETGDAIYDEKMYPASGVISTEESPMEVLEDLRLSMNADFYFRNDKWHLVAGEPQYPDFTVTDDMVLGAESYRNDLPPQERIEALIVRCIVTPADLEDDEGNFPEGEGYVEADLPAISDQPQHLRGTAAEDQLDLRFTEGSANGQRVGRIHYNRAQLGRALTLTLDNRAHELYLSKVVQRYSDRYPHRNGEYQVEGMNWSADLQTCEVSLIEYSRDIYDYDPLTQEQKFDYRTVDSQ